MTAPVARLLRGGSALVLAKVVFVLTGYGIYTSLARILGADGLGVYLVVNSVVAVLNAMFITGTIQTVSRAIAQGVPPRSVVRTALGLQIGVAGTACVGYALAAPLVATLLNDRGLVPLIRLSAVIPLCYAFYAVFVGFLNGSQQFGAQASFDMGFSALKLSLVVGLPLAGLGVTGAVGGFSLASLLITVAALAVVGPAIIRMGGSASWAQGASGLLGFQVSVMAYQALFNLLMQADLLLLKGLSVSSAANADVGVYGAAVKLAQIPQSVLVAVNFIVFPLIAKAQTGTSRLEAASSARRAAAIAAFLVAGPAAVLAATAGPTMALVFGTPFQGGGWPLALLAAGYAALTLTSVGLTMLNGSGRPGASLLLVLGTLTAQVTLASVLIPRWGLVGAAVASLSAFCLGLAATGWVVRHVLGGFLPARDVVRVVVACAAVIAVGTFASAGGLRLLLFDGLLALIYGGVLLLLGCRPWRSERVQGAAAEPSQDTTRVDRVGAAD